MFDYKRLSQQRAQQMPLGGLLGERIAKSMSLYNSQQTLAQTQASVMSVKPLDVTSF